MPELEEPKGIAFFNIKSNETHYCKLEPTIAAYINSSDMGINASRDQDFGWRLAAEWVKRVRAFRRDRMQMQLLSSMHNGQKPNTVQILYFLYGEDLRAFEEQTDEEGAPFEEQYQKEISEQKSNAPATDDEEEIDTDALAEAATSNAPEKPKPKQK